MNQFDGYFEIVVVAVLVIIWSSVNQGFAGVALNSAKQIFFMYGKISEGKDNSMDSDDIQEANKILKKEQVKFYIAATGNFIIWIMAIIKILSW